MNPTKPLALVFPAVIPCLILSLFLVCCSKNNPQAPDPTPPAYTLHINISMQLKQADLAKDPVHKYELIISENSGKVVLDTLVNYYTPVIADVRTSQPLVDVTTIRFRSQDSVYFANVYRAVNPSTWHNFPESDSVAKQSLPAGPAPVPGRMTLTNIKAKEFENYGLNINNGSIISSWQPAYPTITYSYSYVSGPYNYAYLVFPYRHLYKLQTIRGATDTIDFSKPDTAVAIVFKKPSLLDHSSFVLQGYPDTTDLTKIVNVGYYFGPYVSPVDADIVYPGKKGFRKYNFIYQLSDAAGKYQSTCYLPFADTIPNELSIPDPAWYTLPAVQNNTVSVGFGTHKPTYFSIYGSIGDVAFQVTAPPDSNVQHPLNFGPPLKSLLLKDHDLSALRASSVYIYYDREPGYQTYFTQRADVIQAYKKPGNPVSTYEYSY